MNVLIISWVAFVAVVYLLAWIDDLYYRKDLPAQFRNVRRELFEET